MAVFQCCPGMKAVDMPKALSVDLRERVVAAIAAGLSCRAALVREAARSRQDR